MYGSDAGPDSNGVLIQLAPDPGRQSLVRSARSIDVAQVISPATGIHRLPSDPRRAEG